MAGGTGGAEADAILVRRHRRDPTLRVWRRADGTVTDRNILLDAARTAEGNDAPTNANTPDDLLGERRVGLEFGGAADAMMPCRRRLDAATDVGLDDGQALDVEVEPLDPTIE